MHLFVDTNILLSFYHFTGDDLEELNKLIVLLKTKEITLYLTSQVESEFRRNRDVKIADAWKRLKDQHLNLQFPQICKDYPEYSHLRTTQEQYEKSHTALLNKLSEDIRKFSLKADGIISQLFALSQRIPTLRDIMQQARDRMDLGNPPGKNGSLGDAVNWESLLHTVPKKTDLHFVTDDKDYSSPVAEEDFSSFLSGEWKKKKQSKIVYYKRLSGFPAFSRTISLRSNLQPNWRKIY